MTKTRKISFFSYQIDLQFIERGNDGRADSIVDTWDADFFYSLLYSINSLAPQNKKHGVLDEWFMVLDELHVDEHFITGKFKSADYGSVSDLVHADTLESRTNPRHIREGEEQYTHFLIRKKDGLLLLQYNLKLNRSKLHSYLEKFGRNIVIDNGFTTVNISSLLSLDFLEDLRKLDKVKSTVIEITSKEQSDENEFVQSMQGEMAELEATHVSLEYKAKYAKDGLRSVIPYVNKFRGKRGVTAIKVVGDQDGAERKISVNTYNEKFKVDVKADANNNPSSMDLYDKIAVTAKGRDLLKRGE